MEFYHSFMSSTLPLQLTPAEDYTPAAKGAFDLPEGENSREASWSRVQVSHINILPT